MIRPVVLATPIAMALCLAIVSHPIALSIAIVCLGCLVMAPPHGPDLGYLDRPAPARVVVGRVVRRPMPIRFLPPVDDATGHVDVATASRLVEVTSVDGLASEIARLTECYHRAVRSRHRARAASYAARIGALHRAASV